MDISFWNGFVFGGIFMLCMVFLFVIVLFSKIVKRHNRWLRTRNDGW